TLAEWQASPFAGRQQTCQGCHMPDRRHSWHGIHDPDTVAGGLEARTEVTTTELRFSLRNSGVGHMFPTYVPPPVVLPAVALDRGGSPIPDSAAEYVIQRSVEYTRDGWVERSDTRLAPGQTAMVVLRWEERAAARVWVEVDPDDYYRREVFQQLLDASPSGSL